MKIGVIGNSHLAAFKLGWDVLKTEYPDLMLTFYGSPATSMRFFRAEEGALVPTNDLLRTNLLWTSGGQDRIAGDMDAYILVGMGFSFVHCMTLFGTHRPPGHFDPADENQQLISEKFFYAAMDRTLSNSNALMIVDMLRSISSAPLLYAPNPFGTREVLESSKNRQFQDYKLCERVFDFYTNALGSMFPDALVFSQPTGTIVDRMFTREEFSRGSIKLKKGMISSHREDDFFHMNTNFGMCSLREMLKYLGAE